MTPPASPRGRRRAREGPGPRAAGVGLPAPGAAPAAARLAALVPALLDALAAVAPGRVYHEARAALERALLAHALARTGGNQLAAARLLGLNRNTLRTHGRRLGVLPPAPARPAPREG